MADLVAYVIQRERHKREGHEDDAAAIARLRVVVGNHTVTWREPWPA